MLFSQEYDRALWLITQGDKNTQEMVVEFLKKLTGEMYDCIYQLQRSDKFGIGEAKYASLSGADFDFLVEIDNNILTISYSSKINLGERYQLQLALIVDDFFRFSNLKDVYIGSFIYQKGSLSQNVEEGIRMTNIKNDSYVLNGTGVGYFINNIPNNNDRFKSFDRVDVQRMPNDITLENLSVKKRERSIRRKK